MLTEVKPPAARPARKKQTGIRPPRTLTKASRRIWKLIEAQWLLDDGARLNLATALKNYDLGEQAADLLRKEGIVVDDKPHPAIKILKDCDLVMLKAWRSIGLDVEPPRHEIGRPAGRANK